mgnify:CR=1 FL=1
MNVTAVAPLPARAFAEHEHRDLTVGINRLHDVEAMPDVEACAIWPGGDEVGFFRAGEHGGYYLCGEYGPDASFMRCDDAERIIRECVRRYIAAVAKLA